MRRTMELMTDSSHILRLRSRAVVAEPIVMKTPKQATVAAMTNYFLPAFPMRSPSETEAPVRIR